MSDPRFARLTTDPRFRRPKKKQNKVVVDERFKSVLKQEKKKDKSAKGLVDKYGRTLSSTHEEDNLKRFYRLEGDEEEEEAEEAPRRPDYARGEVVMESSSEEEDEDDDKGDESDSNGIVRIGYGSDEPDEDAEIDLDEDNFDLLEAQAAAYSKEHADEEEEDEDEAPRTRRIAAVNLDWDHVRASHLFKIASSVVSPTAPLASSATKKVHPNSRERSLKDAPQLNIVRGKVLNVVIYPSDFGKERMEREEREGPPPEIFKKKKDSEEITEKSLYELGGEDEVDDNALRKYQLERLRYYYAVITCDSVDAASHIYDELQGTELERSANVFDMSFVPDDMTFDNEPRDQATEADIGLSTKGIDFVTPALRHSKVTLTWDEDDPERGQVTRRTLTKQEIEDGDFRKFIASSSESESEGESSKPKGKKDKKSERDRLRALLLGGNDDAMPEGWGDEGRDDDVDMEVTFTPGLTGKQDEGDETSLEKYQRKLREKRKKRKEEVKGKATSAGKGKEKEVDVDDFFAVGSEDEEEDIEERRASGKKKGERKKRSVDEKEKARGEEATAEELALLAASNNPDAETKHFDFKAVLKAEKKGKKGRKHKKDKRLEAAADELQEDFSIDVQDERFKVLHEDHQFAIDPSNPHFKKTKGMSALLEERRKRLSNRDAGAEPEAVAPRSVDAPSNPSLQKLVESVKRKSVEASAAWPGQA
ncbi:pre-rRNA-processing protein ESF1 [Ephemerocybe angulata]|uniref:Pre-rRNA-processing protein ESF1 n=1 Tax=Ephemerocybe angulata TaxID=980116 RepID=A0A8H6IL62_9AGAR|nr:pre-rRNA-processing protein ESF1 [Tulosesus angulatus]